MENLVETITLDVEEQNELAFKVKIEGSPAPAKVRLVCEGDDLSYMFKGYSGEDDVVQFDIPQMKNRLQEGLYNAKVEVFVENRYFTPVQFQIQFKKTVSVVAEAVKVKKQVITPEVRVSAVPIVVPRQQPPAPVAQPKPAPQPAPQPAPVKKTITTESAPPKKVRPAPQGDDSDDIKALIRDVLFNSRKK